MKTSTVTLIAIAALVLAPVAKAQNGAFSVGGMIGLDQKRLEVAPGVHFQAAVYTCPPPEVGFESPGLVGFFSSSLGQYPTLMTGMYIKIVVNPSGINSLQGIDFDPTGSAKLDDKKCWQSLKQEPRGGWSISLYCDEAGPISLRFRMRHRDGRDKYTFLFIVATWVRGGSLPAMLELIVQRRPYEALAMTGEAVFPYLNGFIPATAQAKGQVASQQFTVPTQYATESTVSNGQLQGDAGSAVASLPMIAPFGVRITATHFKYCPCSECNDQDDQICKEAERKIIEDARELHEPSPKTAKETLSYLNVDSSKYGVVIILESSEPFSGEMITKDGRSLALNVEKVGDRYVGSATGMTKTCLDLGIRVVVRQGDQTRTIQLGSQEPHLA